ncbi:carboxymuconolactone decarboxylase family protein [Enterococcus sp. ALS3]|uniref:Carboxymuconolactone decarboxylase family protein n=1 Tax=Enterococcus alishanensis TaxID=1303817 RepID=A0ABS6TH81_9ENTE|nr:carboxymuconolactone decarboxylase family protein [Enterococcus alishanensis]MBV7392245.1 carboxymuconolactone decarboxylase family protein [Enterococcus alishanensis]
MKLSNSFETFAKEAPQYQQAFAQLVETWGNISSLEEKTNHLAYLAVLAATGKTSGIAFHVMLAKKAGASKEEVISAVLVGLPAIGNEVISALPIVVEAYDNN